MVPLRPKWQVLFLVVAFAGLVPGIASAANSALPPIVEGVTSRDPDWGSKSAPVEVVVFSDLQCPACKRYHEVLKKIQETFGDRKLRVVMKQMPLSMHREAEDAARYGLAIHRMSGSRAYWRYVDHAFNAIQDEHKSAKESLLSFPKVRHDKVMKLAASVAITDAIAADKSLAGRLNVRGTPTVFINGLEVNTPTEDHLTQRIKSELAQGEALRRAGVPFNRVARTRTLSNLLTDRTSSDRWRVKLGNSPSRGRANALVTIVTFSDLQCPFCRRLQETLKKVERKHRRDVRFVYKHNPLPFHREARMAADLASTAQSAGGHKFWAFHDAVLAKRRISKTDILELYNKHVGPVPDVGGSTHQQPVDDDLAQAKKLQVTGTPASFVNGRSVSGSQPEWVWEQIIQEELRFARAQVASKQTSVATFYRDTVEVNGRLMGGVPNAPGNVAAPPADAIVTASGLAYRYIRKSPSRIKVHKTSRATVHYTGWTTDGKMFDSSLSRKKPTSFKPTQVIKGWEEGLQLMHPGDKILFWIPKDLAYGASNRPGTPKGMLVFEIELLSVR